MRVEASRPLSRADHPLFAVLPVLAFLLVAVCGLAVRGAWPVDETRYTAVAWEMWWRGDFLVPYLIGEPYSHKPPLLFWLLHAGWWLGGVSEAWPRLLPWLLGLAQLLALRQLARAACPSEPLLAAHALTLHAALTLWLAWTGMLAFDVLLTVCVLMALVPLVEALRTGTRLNGLALGLWLGLALLAKGPVALVYLLPAMLLLPLMRRAAPAPGEAPVATGSDALRLLAALVLAITIAAAWALPAALSGGERYASAILWGQMAGRVVDSFAHRQPAWWYLPWLPLLLFPWSLRPDLFRGASTQHAVLRRWLRWTIISAFGVLCLVSGKQLHYLVPILPLVMLWLALRLPQPGEARCGARRLAGLPSLLPLLLAVGTASVVAGFTHSARWPAWVVNVDSTLPLALLLVAALGWRLSRLPACASLLGPAVTGIGTFVVLQIGLVRLADTDFRMEAIAARLAQAEASGSGWAYIGGYAGEFDLAGRLRRPPVLPADAAALLAWARSADQEAPVLRMFRGRPPEGLPEPFIEQEWRGKRIGAWRAADVAASPGLQAFLAP